MATFDVSIHAPARGATHAWKALSRAHCVSIHAPARGATINGDYCSSTWTCFNPRSRAGSDSSDHLAQCAGQNVSIHAPARGATRARTACSSIRLFQSTLPRGERPLQGSYGVYRWSVSIHAPARGATTSVMAMTMQHGGFNPRSRAGSDGIEIESLPAIHSFNPRSRAGSDVLKFEEAKPAYGFNPRSRAGSDL